MSSLKILVLEPMPINEQEYEMLGYTVHRDYNATEATLCEIIGDYHIVYISKRTDLLTHEVLTCAQKLLAIGVIDTYFYNQVDYATANSMGIPIFLARYEHQAAVAELDIAFMVLLARQIGDRSKEMHLGNWQKTSNDCHEVRGKTLGLIGYGHVGSYLGVLAEALSMKVIFYDTASIMPIGHSQPCASMDELLEQSDFVALHVSSLPENVNMIGREQIEKMKAKSFLLNTSFGKAVCFTNRLTMTLSPSISKVDICRGPHLMHTHPTLLIKHLKVL